MNEDESHLKGLAIGHDAVGGMTMLFACFPLIHTFVGLAITIILSGRFLKQRKHYWFSLVIACIACAFMPFGTVLGVLTIIVLSRASVKELYGMQ